MICCLLATAVCSDWRSYKVKNWIIIMGLSAGLAARLSEFGISGVLYWLLGAAVPIGLLGGLFCYRALGAGDIKLFSVIGGMYGPSVILNTIILAFLAGGVLSIVRLLQTGNFKNRLQYLATFISAKRSKKETKKYYEASRDGRESVIHFTIAIAVGFALCRFFNVSILA